MMSSQVAMPEKTGPGPTGHDAPRSSLPRETLAGPCPPAARPRGALADWKRFIFLVLGGMMLLIGILGVFLPVLPTTPFLLLTSWCLVRASPRLHDRLHRSQLLGPFLRDWEKHHAVRLHVKLTAIAVLVLVAGGTMVFGSLPPVANVGLAALSALGIVVVVRLKLIREDP